MGRFAGLLSMSASGGNVQMQFAVHYVYSCYFMYWQKELTLNIRSREDRLLPE